MELSEAMKYALTLKTLQTKSGLDLEEEYNTTVNEIEERFEQYCHALVGRKAFLLREVKNQYDHLLKIQRSGFEASVVQLWNGANELVVPTVSLAVDLPLELANISQLGKVLAKVKDSKLEILKCVAKPTDITEQITHPEEVNTTVVESRKTTSTGVTEPRGTHKQIGLEPKTQLEAETASLSTSKSSEPLHTLAQDRDLNELKKRLIEKGVNMEAVDTDGETPLHKAARAGRTANVALLINHGANVEAKCSLGNTPLHLAASAGHYTTVELLIRLGGANLKSKNNDGETPHQCAEDGKHKDIERLIADEERCIVM